MAYADAQGRPEIVMHPDIVRGGAGHRIVARAAGEAHPTGGPANAQADHQDTVSPEQPAGAVGEAPAQPARR